MKQKGDDFNGKAKFQIPKIPKTTSKSIRMRNELIDEIEETIIGRNCTFTFFVVQGCKWALENLLELED